MIKMKKILLFSLFVCFNFTIYAQEVPVDSAAVTPKDWKISGMFQTNFSQVFINEYWVAGGENSKSMLGVFKISADYKHEKTNWDNDLDLAYGLMVQDSVKKTDDKLTLSSTFGYNAKGKWYYAANFTLKTQIANGYKYPDVTNPISAAFAPAEMLYVLGIQYKPSEDFVVLISPLTGKTILVLNSDLSDLGAFGITAGEKSYSKLGMYLKLKYKKEIFKNVIFKTKLDLFSDYAELKLDAIDVDWELAVEMKVNKWLSANILTNMIYNKQIIDQVQFKEVFGIGLGLKF